MRGSDTFKLLTLLYMQSSILSDVILTRDQEKVVKQNLFRSPQYEPS